MTAPRRRWSFTLRTLFVVVTMFGCWLGWQAKTVHDRLAVKRQLEAAGGYAWPNDDESQRSWPRWRRFLGDQRMFGMELPPKYDPKLKAELESLFPEAYWVRN
jgi:hypothetical protein